MVFAKQIEEYLCKLAPKELAFENDNVGLLIDSKKQVTGVLCSLDITKDVIKEAVQKKCNVIVSHHPVIFRPLYGLSANSTVYNLVNNDISAICMHTNLDIAVNGVNDKLAQMFNLKNIVAFGDDLGRIGELQQKTNAQEFLKMCENIFGNCRATRHSGEIKKVAVVGGSGSDYMAQAFALGADAYVTGEAAHHCAIYANHIDKLLITAGHYATEHPVVLKLKEYLQENFKQFNIYVSESECDPFI